MTWQKTFWRIVHILAIIAGVLLFVEWFKNLPTRDEIYEQHFYEQ